MPELDPFDARLEHAVHAFADAAHTRVDAAATAERAIRRGRAGRLSWLGYAVPVPVSILIVLALVLLALVLSLGIGGQWNHDATVLPATIASPTPSPAPTVAPDAPAQVGGTGSHTRQSTGTTTLDELGFAHTLGIVIQVETDTDDPRVNGMGTYRLGVDASGALGFAQGTLRLEVPGGSWEGTCSGSTWEGIGAGTLSCWLEGSGPYAGMTFYLSHRFGGEAEPDTLLGTIVPAEPPSP